MRIYRQTRPIVAVSLLGTFKALLMNDVVKIAVLNYPWSWVETAEVFLASDFW